ncbi:hypothetical protein VCV18_001518 [Metarhizium anisopliae]
MSDTILKLGGVVADTYNAASRHLLYTVLYDNKIAFIILSDNRTATVVHILALPSVLRTRPANYPSSPILVNSAIHMDEGVNCAATNFDLSAASSCCTWFTAMNFVEVPAGAARP